MHLVVLLPPGTDDVTVSRKAAQKGVSATPLSTCYLSKPRKAGLILGYGGTDLDQIQDGVRKLKLSMPTRSSNQQDKQPKLA